MNKPIIKTNLSNDYLKSLKHETPYLLIDLKKVVLNYIEIQSALPGFKVHYAVKANNNNRVLEVLHREKASFEIASAGELRRLARINVPANKIIFSNPVKIPDHIKRSYEYGVKIFAVDSTTELEKIAKFAPKSNINIRLKVSNNGSLINLSNKFGATLNECITIAKLAKQKKIGLNGITFHVGSQAESLSVWETALKEVSKLKDALAKVNIVPKSLNIGGGFPVGFNNTIPKIELIGETILSSIKKYKLSSLDLQCEPGRYIVASSGIIVASIIGETKRNKDNWLYLDLGRFQAFIELFESMGILYRVINIHRYSKTKETRPYTLTGPTCDSYDTIATNIALPASTKVGDKLAFLDAGAYTIVYGAPFNDFPIPKTYYK